MCECGIFAHGFARAWCDDCGHDYFVAYSCKGLGVCPSCNTRRMVETAAHLTDHVSPRLPVRQWVLSVPKRLRYFTGALPVGGFDSQNPETLRDRPQLREASQLCPQLIEIDWDLAAQPAPDFEIDQRVNW